MIYIHFDQITEHFLGRRIKLAICQTASIRDEMALKCPGRILLELYSGEGGTDTHDSLLVLWKTLPSKNSYRPLFCVEGMNHHDKGGTHFATQQSLKKGNLT